MKNPKVGERCSFQYNTYLEKHILKGEITKVYDDGQVRIKCDAESTAKGDFLMFPKYCVRLKPKRLRRRIWFPVADNRACGFCVELGSFFSPSQPELDSERWVEFIEVKKK